MDMHIYYAGFSRQMVLWGEDDALLNFPTKSGVGRMILRLFLSLRPGFVHP